MKTTTFYFIIVFFCFTKINAQLIVNAPETDVQLDMLNTQITNLISEISQLNATSEQNKQQNDLARSFAEKEYQLQKQNDEELYRVDTYLRTGREFASILDREARIISKIQNLTKYLNNNPTNSIKNVLLNSATDILNNTGTLVDTSIGVLTDYRYKMTAEQRRSYLKEIDNSLSSLESSIGNLLDKAQRYVSMSKTQEEARTIRNQLFHK